MKNIREKMCSKQKCFQTRMLNVVKVGVGLLVKNNPSHAKVKSMFQAGDLYAGPALAGAGPNARLRRGAPLGSAL